MLTLTATHKEKKLHHFVFYYICLLACPACLLLVCLNYMNFVCKPIHSLRKNWLKRLRHAANRSETSNSPQMIGVNVLLCKWTIWIFHVSKCRHPTEEKKRVFVAKDADLFLKYTRVFYHMKCVAMHLQHNRFGNDGADALIYMTIYTIQFIP